MQPLRARPSLSLACALLLSALWVGLGVALAESVPIGRFARVLYGIDRAHPYAMEGADHQRSGRSRSRVARVRPSHQWSSDSRSRQLTPPVVLSNGMLVTGSRKGLSAFDTTGKLRWQRELGSVLHTPSVTPTGEVLAVTRKGVLFAVDASGASRRIDSDVSVRGVPLVLDSGVLVAGASDGSVHLMDPSGRRLHELPVRHTSPVTISELSRGQVVVAGLDARLSVVSVDGGAGLQLELSQRTVSGPVVGADGTIWVLGEHGALRGLSAGGRTRAAAEVGRSGPTSIAAVGRDGAVRVGAQRFELVCYGPNGTERWRRGVDGQPGAVTLDADDVALFITTRGTLYALDHDGTLIWKQDVRARAAPRPVLGADGTIYVAMRNGRLAAWK